MKTFLSELGFQSDSYESGKKALSAIKTDDVSCVITGLELSDVKGEAFISELAALERHISIIVFSSNTDERRTKFLEEQGVIGVVQKNSDWKEELNKFFV